MKNKGEREQVCRAGKLQQEGWTMSLLVDNLCKEIFENMLFVWPWDFWNLSQILTFSCILLLL